MSLMTTRSDSPLMRTVRANSRCSWVRSVISSRSVMPMTPFIGVRISWLMLARNSLLSRLLDSACTMAACSAMWARWRSVMSLLKTATPLIASLVWIGL